MAICAKCGNQIPEWSHGVCYTCVRNEDDWKRYGRRRPSRKKPGATQGQKGSKTVRCHDCGRRVSRKNLRRHKEKYHRVRIPDEVIKPLSKKESKPEHRARYALRKDQTPPLARGQQVGTKGKRRESPGTTTTAPVHPLELLDRINLLLEDVYLRPIRLSQILRKDGLDRLRVKTIKNNLLGPYLYGLVAAWKENWRRTLPPGSVKLLVARYGLEGNSPRTMSGFEQRRLTVTIGRLRRSTAWLEEIALRTAIEVTINKDKGK